MYKSGPELSRRDVLHIIVRVKLKYNRSEMGDVECSRGGNLLSAHCVNCFIYFVLNCNLYSCGGDFLSNTTLFPLSLNDNSVNKLFGTGVCKLRSNFSAKDFYVILFLVCYAAKFGITL